MSNLEHDVYDNDTRFVIDPVTRRITNEGNPKRYLIQDDHNSERFTFEIPKYIDGHDMSSCNAVEVHYANVDGKTKAESKDVYIVNDVQSDGENTLVFSWLISQNATKYAGGLGFLIVFKCVDNEGNVNYVWHTAPYEKIKIIPSIDNGEIVIEEYADILESWRREVLAEVYALMDTANALMQDTIVYAEQAINSASQAKVSKDNAKVSEDNAKTSETNSKASENKAKTSETNAKASENKAKTSENNAKTSETNAGNSATSATASAQSALASASSAETSASIAQASEESALASAQSALESATAQAPGIVCNAEGVELITVHDSADRPMVGFKVVGKVDQNTYGGTNFFDISKVESSTRVINNGDTLSVTAGTGSSVVSGSGDNLLRDYCPNLVVGNTYTLTAQSTGSTKEIYLFETHTYWKFGKSLVITEEHLNSMVGFYANGDTDTTFTATISKIQVNDGSVAVAYEPYCGNTSSPNPDYPQPIQCVKEGTVIRVCGKNILPYPYSSTVITTKNGLTVTDNGDGTITINGTAENTTSFNLLSAPLKVNGTYTLSGISGGSGSTYYVQPMSSERSYGGLTDGSKTYEFSNVELIKLNFNIAEGTTISNMVCKFMFEKNEIVTDFEPYTGHEVTAPCDLYEDDVWYPQTGIVEKHNKEYVMRSDTVGSVEANGDYTRFSLASYFTEGVASSKHYCERLVGFPTASGGVDMDKVNNSTSPRLFIHIKSSRLSETTLWGVRQYFEDMYNAGTPISIIAKVNTPIIEQYEPQVMETYAGLTNVMQIPVDLMGSLNMDYIVDTETYITASTSPINKGLKDHDFRIGYLEAQHSGTIPTVTLETFACRANTTIENAGKRYAKIVKIYGKYCTVNEINNYVTPHPNPPTELRKTDGSVLLEFPTLESFGTTEDDFIFFRNGKAYYQQATRIGDYDSQAGDGENVIFNWGEYKLIRLKEPIITDISDTFPFDGFLDFGEGDTFRIASKYAQSNIITIANNAKETYGSDGGYTFDIGNAEILFEMVV